MTGRNLHSLAAETSVPSAARPSATDPSRRSVDPATEAWAIDQTVAQSLWDRLIRARTESPIVSVAEDAVFRFYLPLARSLARSLTRGSAKPDVKPDRAEQAAELGLARAVLAWRQRDSTAFAAFARGVILHQIQAIPARTAARRQPNAAMAARPSVAN
jgi:hypothetical protein